MLPDWSVLAERFDGPGVRAIFLMGSHARGDAGPFSDVDLWRLLDEGVEATPVDGSYLVAGVLVVASSVTLSKAEDWLTRPDLAVQVIAGLRSARALVDRGGAFAAIQARARSLVWDAAMQAKANVWVSQEMTGWSEEAHKGLEGLRRGDRGRLLHARYGCTWGLSRVISVYRGLLLSSENALYDELIPVMGRDSEWVRLRRAAFGIEDAGSPPPTLREQVVAGLRLYALTAELVRSALQPNDAPLVERTVERITEALESNGRETMETGFTLVEVLKAAPQEIYDAWLDSTVHSEMTGGAAHASAQVGADFDAWDGYIQGKNLELEPGRRILQAWRTRDFAAGDPDSRLEITLEPHEEGTRLTLIHSQLPTGQEEEYRRGWWEAYFEPMADHFAQEG